MDINLKQFGYVMYVMHSDEDQHEYQIANEMYGTDKD